jgi:hypothetical protein
LLLLLFFLPFTWGRHRSAHATTALPGATSLELLILFAAWVRHGACTTSPVYSSSNSSFNQAPAQQSDTKYYNPEETH